MPTSNVLLNAGLCNPVFRSEVKCGSILLKLATCNLHAPPMLWASLGYTMALSSWVLAEVSEEFNLFGHGASVFRVKLIQ